MPAVRLFSEPPDSSRETQFFRLESFKGWPHGQLKRYARRNQLKNYETKREADSERALMGAKDRKHGATARTSRVGG
jgi:hypothetical protein